MIPTRIAADFLPHATALALRGSIDKHFSEPHRHTGQTHQIWNYWYVHGMYTYLRASPEKIFEDGHFAQFMNALRSYAQTTLGRNSVSQPFLSMYVDGCGQGWHNDAMNGSFAYVYSLTRDSRRSMGGNTLVMRPGDLFERRKSMATAGTDLYEEIEPRFNRLIVFDDRAIHSVSRVEGSMDPGDARFVLHGHIR